jgi:hypothetical protein
MRQRLAFFVMLSAAASVSRADILYQVSVDTSSMSGTSGSLDFQFNPGPFASQAASLQLLNFGGGGTFAGSPSLTGAVTGGPLPSALTFDNGSPFNDYFDGFTFGSTLHFEVSLSGPALNAPDGTSTSGSTFAFSMFSDAAGTIPALTTDTVNGFATTIDINLDGSTSVTNLSAQTSVGQASPTSEPGSLVLLGTAMALLGAFRWRKSRSDDRPASSATLSGGGPYRTRCHISMKPATGICSARKPASGQVSTRSLP